MRSSFSADHEAVFVAAVVPAWRAPTRAEIEIVARWFKLPAAILGGPRRKSRGLRIHARRLKAQKRKTN